MRTTLTLDDDVSVTVEHLRATYGLSMKQAVNEMLRAGGRVFGEERPAAQAGVTRSFDAGEPYLPSIDNVAEALAYAEGEDFR